MALVLYTTGRKQPLATGALAVVGIKALLLPALIAEPWSRQTRAAAST